MLAGSLITASSRMRPWQEGQRRTVRAKSSAHGRYPPAGETRMLPETRLERASGSLHRGRFRTGPETGAAE